MNFFKMKATTISDVKRGYIWGITSGMSWGLDTVLIGLIMSTTTFATSTSLLVSGALVCSFFMMVLQQYGCPYF